MSASASPSTLKRRRGLDDDASHDGHNDKRTRPTTVPSSSPEDRLWHPRDSVLSSPAHVAGLRDSKYDSDDQSSMVSEPGSPQALSQVSEEDVSMLSDDGDDEDESRVLAAMAPHAQHPPPLRPWRSRPQTDRVPTPILSPQRGSRAHASHVRQRHPQENLSSAVVGSGGGAGLDRLEVPSPIDEDEIATPPSAAEAAGSQLELLRVSDVDMDVSGGAADDGHTLPAIAVGAERSLQLDGASGPEQPDFEPMEDCGGGAPDALVVPKTRARSGALSAGDGSPLHTSPAPGGIGGVAGPFGGKRGFSMGFRSDCEKCLKKVPGHMNHFF